MTQGRSNTPSWVPHLMGALLTAGTVWATIRTEVPAMVEEAVHAEVEASAARMMARQDSAWAVAQTALHARIEVEAGAVRDSMLSVLQLITDRPTGRVVYSPNITVAPDTVATALLVSKLDSITNWQRDILRQLAVLSTAAPDRKGSRKGSDGWKR
jgi:hypothetical protein